MSDNTINAVKAYMYNQNNPSLAKDINSIHVMELRKGKRAKSVLDKQRTSQNYYRTLEVQKPLLDHYENVDWWERDSSYDFTQYAERK